MSERVSRTILLCEDDPQQRLVRLYLRECGLRTEPPYFVTRNASREVHGGNVGWVLHEFPKELLACRQRHTAHANTLLVVVVDADDLTVAERRGHFSADTPLSDADPLVMLIPRRHIETWIRAARKLTVNETDSYKNPEPKKSEVGAAAKQIHAWARNNPRADSNCIPSLQMSFSEWRRIG